MSNLNDPRVFFAAERTLLAWNRTSLALMAFGFVIERFGLFVHMLVPEQAYMSQRGISFWIGMAFILLGSMAALAAVAQHRVVLMGLTPSEVPAGYHIFLGVIANVVVGVLGIGLTAYIFSGF